MELMKNPEVEFAVPVLKGIHALHLMTPGLVMQWGLTKIGMTGAWALSKGDTNVVIGIVDSGTDWTHEDLTANIKNKSR